MIDKNIKALMDQAGTKVYYAADLPDEIEFGETGQCFDTCIIRALHNPQYRYVEGMAQIKGQWYLHAWLTDGINAFDPTWGSVDNLTQALHAAPAKYIGVEMPTKAVAEFMKATGYQGILANHWRNPKLANRCLFSQSKVLA